MANLTVGQVIVDAQRMANRVKDLDALSSALLVEAESNNRFVESLRLFQNDMDSLNQIVNNKSNVEMVNRIQQQNANCSELMKENRELKVCVEDYERGMELIMQKYREHISNKILGSKTNFKDVYNEKLWKIIRDQRQKINEMAAVMQKAAFVDDDFDLEAMTRLRLENKTLRDLLQISKQFGTQNNPIRFNEYKLLEKAVQTEMSEDSADELSLSGASMENNNSVIHISSSDTASIALATCRPSDNASFESQWKFHGDNNNSTMANMGANAIETHQSSTNNDSSLQPCIPPDNAVVNNVCVSTSGCTDESNKNNSAITTST